MIYDKLKIAIPCQLYLNKEFSITIHLNYKQWNSCTSCCFHIKIKNKKRMNWKRVRVSRGGFKILLDFTPLWDSSTTVSELATVFLAVFKHTKILTASHHFQMQVCPNTFCSPVNSNCIFWMTGGNISIYCSFHSIWNLPDTVYTVPNYSWPPTFMWVIICALMLDFWLNRLSQTLHLNGFSPVWMNMWRCAVCFVANSLLQMGHFNGSSFLLKYCPSKQLSSANRKHSHKHCILTRSLLWVSH